jgi:hypothetical protein
LDDKPVVSGHGVTYWGVSHKDSTGKLICRLAIVEPPDPIECPSWSCTWKFLIKNIKYVLTLLYHEYRVKYAEASRGKEIPAKYRTGLEVPESLWGLFWAIMKVPRA